MPPEREPSTRVLWLLVVLSLLLPVAGLAIGAVISYRAHFEDAHDRLQRDLNRVYEHALKVFETFDLSAKYLDEMLNEATDENIRANEREISGKLKAIKDTLPQLRDIWVIDAKGVPVVSGTVFPMPQVDLSDRSYFTALKHGDGPRTYISAVMDARVADLKFFAISRPRKARDGTFAGVTVISVAPEYFTNYYAKLPKPSIYSLVREDGEILARYPEPSRPGLELDPNGPFMTQIRAQPESGFAVGVSSLDGHPRTYAYQRLPNYGVYVAAGLDDGPVIDGWMRDLSRHLIFGVPATIAMFALSLIALRRTKRATVAFAQLKQEVARRELTEKALRQAQKMEAVGRLTGGIAHDFNNLLTAILGNIDLAMRRLPQEDDRIRRLLSSARQASDRAATLVQRLLSYSRQHPLEFKAVDINRLVQNMSELLRRTIGETVTVETVLAGGLWKTAVDPNQLENAIINLAINARDAMPEGGRLTIETANTYLDEGYTSEHGGEFGHGQYVMLAVTDAGSGMTKDVIDRAFEPFFTTKPTGVGTGLGLSMVYGFVKQSAGHIKIYSEPGEGTSIKMYFPRLEESSDLPAWIPPEPEEKEVDPDDTAATILLVEDDEEVNRFATEVLREEGYNVISTHEGPSALRLLDANPNIDLLFTDVVLPGGMNGRQLADEALRRRPSLKVLYATGYTRNAIIHQGRLDADVELLTKPFTPDILASKVKQILEADSKLKEAES